MSSYPRFDEPMVSASLRFTKEELALMDALSSYHADKNGGRFHRAEILRKLLKKVAIPDEQSPLAAEVRRRFEAAFPKVTS